MIKKEEVGKKSMKPTKRARPTRAAKSTTNSAGVPVVEEEIPGTTESNGSVCVSLLSHEFIHRAVMNELTRIGSGPKELSLHVKDGWMIEGVAQTTLPVEPQ